MLPQERGSGVPEQAQVHTQVQAGTRALLQEYGHGVPEQAHVHTHAGGHERFYKSEGYDAGTNVLRMVGYFSLTGLLRVHTLVGDYQGALRALGVVHPFQRANLFAPKIAGAPYEGVVLVLSPPLLARQYVRTQSRRSLSHGGHSRPCSAGLGCWHGARCVLRTQLSRCSRQRFMLQHG